MNDQISPAPPAKRKPGKVFWLVVIAIGGLGTLVAIPNFVKARQTSCGNSCVANLKQLDGAKEQWALETHASSNSVPALSDLCGADKYIKNTPVCPVNGEHYRLNAVSVPPICPRGSSVTPAHILPQ